MPLRSTIPSTSSRTISASGTSSVEAQEKQRSIQRPNRFIKPVLSTVLAISSLLSLRESAVLFHNHSRVTPNAALMREPVNQFSRFEMEQPAALNLMAQHNIKASTESASTGNQRTDSFKQMVWLGLNLSLFGVLMARHGSRQNTQQQSTAQSSHQLTATQSIDTVADSIPDALDATSNDSSVNTVTGQPRFSNVVQPMDIESQQLSQVTQESESEDSTISASRPYPCLRDIRDIPFYLPLVVGGGLGTPLGLLLGQLAQKTADKDEQWASRFENTGMIFTALTGIGAAYMLPWLARASINREENCFKVTAALAIVPWTCLITGLVGLGEMFSGNEEKYSMDSKLLAIDNTNVIIAASAVASVLMINALLMHLPEAF